MYSDSKHFYRCMNCSPAFTHNVIKHYIILPEIDLLCVHCMCVVLVHLYMDKHDNRYTYTCMYSAHGLLWPNLINAGNNLVKLVKSLDPSTEFLTGYM